MLLSRLFLLLFACALLLTQQNSSAHALSHALAGQMQQDKQAPHSHHCELCALDSQLGSALNSATINFALALLPAATWTQSAACLHHTHVLSATARGPPATLQQTA